MTETWTIEQFKAHQAQKGGTVNKYHAQPKIVDSIRFHSTREANRYTDLKLMQNAGEITGLQRQVKFDLHGVKYFADFVYFDYAKKSFIVEDCKGYRTTEYKNKKKQMLTIYNIEIFES